MIFFYHNKIIIILYNRILRWSCEDWGAGGGSTPLPGGWLFGHHPLARVLRPVRHTRTFGWQYPGIALFYYIFVEAPAMEKCGIKINVILSRFFSFPGTVLVFSVFQLNRRSFFVRCFFNARLPRWVSFPQDYWIRIVALSWFGNDGKRELFNEGDRLRALALNRAWDSGSEYLG